MQKAQKEQIVDQLAARLASADTLIVADYRGLTNKQFESLRDELLAHGARFSVVKNTLTRRAARQAGADALLVLLEGPSAIAFIQADGDPAAVAKALAKTGTETNVLALKGGVLQGRTMTGEEVAELAKLPSTEVLRGQVLGAIVAPLTQLVALLGAPVQDLVGLIDARVAQLAEAAPSASTPEDVETTSSSPAAEPQDEEE